MAYLRKAMIEERTQFAVFGLLFLGRLACSGLVGYIGSIGCIGPLGCATRIAKRVNLLHAEDHVILWSRANEPQTLVSTS